MPTLHPRETKASIKFSEEEGYPGTILSETTEGFQKLFKSADLILAKGQGNFETLLPLADKRLYFLLRIKCQHMAALAQVDKDSLVLMQGR